MTMSTPTTTPTIEEQRENMRCCNTLRIIASMLDALPGGDRVAISEVQDQLACDEERGASFTYRMCISDCPECDWVDDDELLKWEREGWIVLYSDSQVRTSKMDENWDVRREDGTVVRYVGLPAYDEIMAERRCMSAEAGLVAGSTEVGAVVTERHE